MSAWSLAALSVTVRTPELTAEVTESIVRSSSRSTADIRVSDATRFLGRISRDVKEVVRQGMVVW